MSTAYTLVVALLLPTYLLVALFPLGTHSVAFIPPTSGKSFSLSHHFQVDTALNTTPSPGLWTQDTHACPPGFIQTGTGVGCRRGAHPLHLQAREEGGQYQNPVRAQPFSVTENKVQILLMVWC
jgi:hypothetical protein